MVRNFLDGLSSFYSSFHSTRYFSYYLGSKWPQIFHSLYWIASKVIFMFGLLLTILPSCLGVTNSFFNLILNSKLFVFIARISYCTYLLHIMIVYGFIETRSYDIYYSLLDQLLLYLGLLVICLFFGFVMTVTIEVPFGNLLKISISKDEKSKVKKSLASKDQSLLTS